MERTRQNGSVVGRVKAEPTEDYKGRPTITVTSTLVLDERNQQSTVVQLTEEAAQALLSDLLRLTAPAKPRHLVEVVFKDGGGMAEFENASYTVRHGELVEIEIEDGGRGTVPMGEVLYVRTHAK